MRLKECVICCTPTETAVLPKGSKPSTIGRSIAAGQDYVGRPSHLVSQRGSFRTFRDVDTVWMTSQMP